MNINLIAAMAGESRVIGRDGGLPWHIPADLAHFQTLTMGHPIIMGRKTYESIGKPLPGRTNIVLSRNTLRDVDLVVAAYSLKDALIKAASSTGSAEIFIIGGEGVFKEALGLADRLYLTLIAREIPGDTFFPPYKHLFRRTTSIQTINSAGYAIMFETIER